MQRYKPKYKSHTIYALYDPRDVSKEIRYVGATHISPEKRLIEHLSGARRSNRTHKQKWMRKLLRAKVVPAITLLEEEITSSDWEAREVFWIAEYRRRGHRLTNSTGGGDGLVEPSLAVRKRIAKKVSESLVGNSRRTGKRHSIEDRKKISVGLRKSKKARRAFRAKRGVLQPQLLAPEAIAASAATRTGKPRPDMVGFGKAQAEKNRGSFWVNNGIENRLMRLGDDIPGGFVKGRLLAGRPHTQEAKDKLSALRLGKPGPVFTVEGREKISERRKRSRWVTNGVEIKTIPVGAELPSGWRFGMKLNVEELT